MKYTRFPVLVCMVLALVLTPNLCAQPLSEPDQHQTGNSFYDALIGGRFRTLLRYSGQQRNSNLQVLQDDSDPDISDTKIQQYSALGGYLGYQTGSWFNTTVGATVYAAVPFGNNPADRRGLGGLYEENGDQDAYAALGELYIQYQESGHLLKLGRQEMPGYRFVSMSNIRVSPVTHSGLIYENRVMNNVAINFAYISQMKERNAKKFIDMAKGARVYESSNGKQLIRGEYNRDDYDSSGYIGAKKEMTLLSLVLQNERYRLEAWDYYVEDFVNTVFLYGQYNIDPPESRFGYVLAAQYTRQKDVGDHIAGNIDTWHYGLSFRLSADGLGFFVNYDQVAYNENSYDGGTIFVRWGTPQMFNSFQVQDSELAGTKSYGVGFQYDFGRNGSIPGVVMRWRYGHYNLPDDLLMTDARQDRSEATFDLRYSLGQKSGFGIFTEMKGFSLQFRLGYNNYRTDYSFEAYRKIHGYDFNVATKDFLDARLYIDYLF